MTRLEELNNNLKQSELVKTQIEGSELNYSNRDRKLMIESLEYSISEWKRLIKEENKS